MNKPFVVLLVLLLAASVLAAVEIGADKETVLREWGQPSGQLKEGKTELWLYSRNREVSFVDGKVVAVKDAPAPAPKPTAPKPATAVTRPKTPARPPVQVRVYPLHRAAATGRTNDIVKVLATGVDINARDDNGDTALHWLVRNPIGSQFANLTFLLANGADPNATNRHGRTPLHEATTGGRKDTIEILLKNKADINAPDNYRRTPLQLAVITRKKGVETQLRVAGADATLKDRFGLTAADIAREQDQWVFHDIADYQLKDVTFGKNLFVAVGDKLWTSTDGFTWKPRATPEKERFCGVSFTGDEFYATGMGGVILRSADAVTWTAHRHKHNIRNPCRQVARSGNLWLAMDETGNVRLSPNGADWDYGTPPARAGRLCGMAVVNGEFVIVNSKGMCVTSCDGKTWKQLAAPRDEPFLLRMRHLNGEFFAVGYKGVIIRSRDGITWTAAETEVENNLTDIAYGNGRYVAVGAKGALLVSTDGQHWAWRTLGDPKANYPNLTSICYGQNAFIAVGRDAIWSNHAP